MGHTADNDRTKDGQGEQQAPLNVYEREIGLTAGRWMPRGSLIWRCLYKGSLSLAASIPQKRLETLEVLWLFLSVCVGGDGGVFDA
jgi:hypothetical protein